MSTGSEKAQCAFCRHTENSASKWVKTSLKTLLTHFHCDNVLLSELLGQKVFDAAFFLTVVWNNRWQQGLNFLCYKLVYGWELSPWAPVVTKKRTLKYLVTFWCNHTVSLLLYPSAQGSQGNSGESCGAGTIVARSVLWPRHRRVTLKAPTKCAN